MPARHSNDDDGGCRDSDARGSLNWRFRTLPGSILVRRVTSWRSRRIEPRSRYENFTSFTDDLEAIASWLQACECRHHCDGIDRASYWIPLYELLESRGFYVYLVNARHVKNVSGRKIGCSRLPVAAATDELRTALWCFPAKGRDLCLACSDAAAGHADQVSVPACSAHAEGAWHK